MNFEFRSKRETEVVVRTTARILYTLEFLDVLLAHAKI